MDPWWFGIDIRRSQTWHGWLRKRLRTEKGVRLEFAFETVKNEKGAFEQGGHAGISSDKIDEEISPQCTDGRTRSRVPTSAAGESALRVSSPLPDKPQDDLCKGWLRCVLPAVESVAFHLGDLPNVGDYWM